MSRTLPISLVKAHLPELVAGVQAREEEIIVTRKGRPAAVLINYDEYERVRETLSIVADTEFAASIKKGRRYFAAGGKGIPFEKVFSVEPNKAKRAR